MLVIDKRKVGLLVIIVAAEIPTIITVETGHDRGEHTDGYDAVLDFTTNFGKLVQQAARDAAIWNTADLPRAAATRRSRQSPTKAMPSLMLSPQLAVPCRRADLVSVPLG
ncbi:hypothetical protein [Rathayibacter toxicus]|uniref:Uncharacterized protein n=1 Tax=Rathayibacter toxicus TaxID=145458 RepID=A0A0C5BR73_9MICO|nr:hypothetical protein [Rathayibacter toxicus]AJM77142.1 hypothetical protein TI83_02570 [Rathayibacter toxicus]ALS57016.1 hypothetical protein APU90_03900 [Rathayibacter toxicus]KKM46156.1 hypothetical protein VT73_03595 [Rathayibacter toxicus]PPG23108.1 hypothetical protein C5D15_02355 [Rathayibacter toxicus]PPG47691.1 hypothetical protein C5D16_02350 [Rathayibacter toxicus]